MAKILENRQLDGNFFLLKVDQGGQALPGQFYMLSPSDSSLLLPRPISILDQGQESTSFLLANIGKGTANIQEMKEGQEIHIEGPYGNGFPHPEGKKTLLVGGGTGIAPFYHMLSYWPEEKFQVVLGLREVNKSLENLYHKRDSQVKFVYGDFVTDHLDLEDVDQAYTCGPKAMMESLYRKAQGKEVYVSFEERMGCGFGACLACSCQTTKGRKKVCKDGPVFRGEEVL